MKKSSLANLSLQINRAKSSIYLKIVAPEYIIVNLQNTTFKYHSDPANEKYSFTKNSKDGIFTSKEISEIYFRLEDFLK
ncbi:MAG: hypothetical protein L6Q54_05850 [Leptospiraceae bacterium]|nr:hypothetical protein [Leptospiraceae bacterium]MCK6380760.1 hypothetical protein [Leptospiraceae bacterium]